MWRLYLKTNEGVVIQSTYQKLIDALSHNEEDIYPSKIHYINYETDTWGHDLDYPIGEENIFTPIVHKRSVFRKESELRVFQKIEEAIHNDKYWESQPNSKGKNISVNLKTLVINVILHPTAGEDVEIKVKNILRKYKCNFEIMPSKLIYPPAY